MQAYVLDFLSGMWRGGKDCGPEILVRVRGSVVNHFQRQGSIHGDEMQVPMEAVLRGNEIV